MTNQPIPRALLAKIVDEVFGGGVEDDTPIRDIYRVIAREFAPVLREAGQGASRLLKRATDLHEKAFMPWADAEEAALSEIGVGDAEINELILNCSVGVSPILCGEDEIRQFTRSVLVHQPAALATTPPEAAPASGELARQALEAALEELSGVLDSYVSRETSTGRSISDALSLIARTLAAAPAPAAPSEAEIAELRLGLGQIAAECFKSADLVKVTCCSRIDALLARFGHAAAQEPAGLREAEGDTYLCQAWGETDFPAAAIVTGLDAVRQFLIEQWTGSADKTDHDGTNTIEAAMQDMRNEWEREGEAWVWQVAFEIGGVSVQQVNDFSPAPGAATESSNEK